MEHSLRSQVGRRIKEIRKAARLTQEELARRADISAKHLGEIERGHENVSLDYIGRISGALRVEPFELLLTSVLARKLDARRPRPESRVRLDRLDPDAVSFVSDVLAVYLAHRREAPRPAR